MNEIRKKDLGEYLGKTILFKMNGWKKPIKALVVRNGIFTLTDGRSVKIRSTSFLNVIYLEESVDRCTWCSQVNHYGMDCNLYIYVENKGR